MLEYSKPRQICPPHPPLVCMQIEGDEVAQRLLTTRLETQRLRSQIEVLQEQQQALDQLRRAQEQVGGSWLCCRVPARPAALPAMRMLQPLPAMQHQLCQSANAVARQGCIHVAVAPCHQISKAAGCLGDSMQDNAQLFARICTS